MNKKELLPARPRLLLSAAAARAPMAPACVKLWTRCLPDLQHLPDSSPIAQAVTASKVAATLAQWRELPRLSARDWRKLVLEVKVWGQRVLLSCWNST